MKDKFLELLSKTYLKSPAYVLTTLSGNSSYTKAGDAATQGLFKTLEPLYTGDCSHRVNTWWTKRYSVLQALKTANLIKEEDMIKFY